MSSRVKCTNGQKTHYDHVIAACFSSLSIACKIATDFSTNATRVAYKNKLFDMLTTIQPRGPLLNVITGDWFPVTSNYGEWLNK